MMVTFVSQCEKKALKKTRRVLDAFANRIGNNTWQSIITEEGLKAVKKLLRKTATKNTAVSCHWIRSRSRSHFLWVVGNRNKFNEQGNVPVNYTEKDFLKYQFENDWKYLQVIKSLAAFVGLFHDWGKSSALFQEKLNPNSENRYKGDPLRHEWITCLLLHALIRCSGGNCDEQWLTALAKGEVQEAKIIEIAKNHEKKPLYEIPSVAKLILWIIISHHRLPVPDEIGNWRDTEAENIEIVLKRIVKSWGYENRYDEVDYKKRLDSCFSFPKGLMLESGGKWGKEVQKHASRLLSNLNLIQQAYDDGSYRSILHHTRLCLMLGDHYYSSQKEADKKWKEAVSLYANSNHSGYKQKLDEHLFHVAKTAINIAHNLPVFEKQLPRTDDIRFLKRASPTLYRWQDKAVEQINLWKSKKGVEKCGFFAVNMASTGCGKTVANAKVMRGLSEDGQSLRYILALGLRTLTLQTGDEYRERIGLDDTELAVLIGSKAVIDLHKQAKKDVQSESLTSSGSESSEALMDEDVDFDCDIPEEKLSTVLNSEKDRKFLHAPVLACTIDHMMGATETTRGGRFILPSLRLMSSDLVIDEIDDFTGADLIAIGRLIHLAGMLGRKVMISSATIPPDMAEGYYNAYRSGWAVHNKMHDDSNNLIGCAWIDEFSTKVSSLKVSDSANLAYNTLHNEYIKNRISKLKQQKPKRKAGVIECQSAMENCEFELDETKQESYFNLIKDATIARHDLNYTVDKKTGKKVSFGVIRVANINPCVNLTRYLLRCELPGNYRFKTMAYHSRQVLLLRHEQEVHLDEVLKRKEVPGEQPEAFSNPIIREALDACDAENLLFILVATPVEEVGRDHDFDWATMEPSSNRSIIQLAGRVRRHRQEAANDINIGLMQFNWKAFKSNDEEGKAYFRFPGYETGEDGRQLNSHDLTKLLNEQAIAERLDAISRIQKPKALDHHNSLSDLEHYAIREDLNSLGQKGPETLQGYLSQHWYLTALPQKFNPFRKSHKSVNLYLTYDEDNSRLFFAEKNEKGFPVNIEKSNEITHVHLSAEETKRLWLVRDYQKSIEAEADKRETTLRSISLRFGEINLTQYNANDDIQYEYCDQFGLVKIVN